MTSTYQIAKRLKLIMEEYSIMPRKRSYSSQIAHIKDTLESMIKCVDDLDQDFSEIMTDATKYREIKPLLDKLAPVSPISPGEVGETPPTSTKKTRQPRIKKTGKNDNTETPGQTDT